MVIHMESEIGQPGSNSGWVCCIQFILMLLGKAWNHFVFTQLWVKKQNEQDFFWVEASLGEKKKHLNLFSFLHYKMVNI